MISKKDIRHELRKEVGESSKLLLENENLTAENEQLKDELNELRRKVKAFEEQTQTLFSTANVEDGKDSLDDAASVVRANLLNMATKFIKLSVNLSDGSDGKRATVQGALTVSYKVL